MLYKNYIPPNFKNNKITVSVTLSVVQSFESYCQVVIFNINIAVIISHYHH